LPYMAFFNITWMEAFTTLKPLVIFMFGIVIYAIFIYKFYQLIPKKDILGLFLHKKSDTGVGWLTFIVRRLLYILENLILIPLVILISFVILASFLLLLSKSQTTQTTMLVSMALVGSVRVLAYYHEDLSRELAKLLPLVLLGIFLMDVSYVSLTETINRSIEVLMMTNELSYYFLFIVVLEFCLRLLSYLFNPYKDTDMTD
jgi:hypothetical protein